jgi:hypothetical protein
MTLHLFNKSGELIDLEPISSFLYAKVWFNKQSIDLFETESFFILERVILNGEITYTVPTSPLKIELKWADKENEISLYTSQAGEILKLENIIYTLPDNTASVIKQGDINEVNSINNLIYQSHFKVLSVSSEEKIITSTLNILINDVLWAVIDFSAQYVGIDERYETWMSNLVGNIIGLEDSYIFKTTDIKEIAPDFIKINAKRKEFLVNKEELINYIGSYKGILNIIKYFEWDNVYIKEWWKNLKFSETDPDFNIMWKWGDRIDILEPNAQLNDKYVSPSSTWKKSGLFTLFYRINDWSPDVLDEFDLPIINEILDFTQEEILIKLTGLKNKLKRYFLPANSRIVDIIGEGDYFNRHVQKSWNYVSRSLNVQTGSILDFSVIEPKENFLQDLRPYLWAVKSSIESDLQSFSSIPQFFNNFNIEPETNKIVISKILSGEFQWGEDKINDFVIGYLYQKWGDQIQDISDGWYDSEIFNSLFFQLDNDENVPIGYPVTLINKSLISQWNSYNSTNWNELKSLNYTWDNIDFGEYYEIQWNIFLRENENGHTFSLNRTGNISNLNSITVILPYVGKYDVELILKDYHNCESKKYSINRIEVQQKQVELCAWKVINSGNVTWNDLASSNMTWNSFFSEWNNVYLHEFNIDDFEIKWDNFKLSNLYDWDKDHYNWDNLSMELATWNLLDHLTWDQISISKEINHFTIAKQAGIESHEIQMSLENLQINKRLWGYVPLGYNLWEPTIHSANISGTIIQFVHLKDKTKTQFNEKWDIIKEYQISSNSFNDLVTEFENSSDDFLKKFTYNPVWNENKTRYISLNIKLKHDEVFDKDVYIFYKYPDYIVQDEKLKGDFALIGNPIFFGLENIEPINKFKTIKKFDWVVLTPNKSKISGQSKFNWLIRNGNNIIKKSETETVFLPLINRGIYSCELNILDTNGNFKQTQRNIINVV